MAIRTSQEFLASLDNPDIRRFFSDFERWNSVAGPFMNQVCYPYISLRANLAEIMKGWVGSVLMDYGSGPGYIAAALVHNSGASKVIAVDPDLGALGTVPDNLAASGYNGEVDLIQSSSMVCLPLKDETVDTIVSSLGGIAYSGFFLNHSGMKMGQEALLECLKECRRVLRAGGVLGFSSLIPNPNFKRIKWEGVWDVIRKGQFRTFIKFFPQIKGIEAVSAFMLDCASSGKAHYLSEQQWTELLAQAGFTVVKARNGGYAGQGIAIVAQKA
jgi:ubiquinone/menaquinone biosynthesis C-methylase UbiE